MELSGKSMLLTQSKQTGSMGLTQAFFYALPIGIVRSLTVFL